MKKIKYNPSFCEEVLAFFTVPAFRVTEVQKKDGTISVVETACELPTFAAFAQKIGVTRQTLKKWEAQFPSFRYACEQARDRQANLLLQNSLRGNYASSFAMFAAKNLLGWKESKDTAPAGPVEISWEDEHD